MGYETKVIKNFNLIEHQTLGLGILAGFIISVIYLSPSALYSSPFSNVSLHPPLSMIADYATQLSNDSVISYPETGKLGNETNEKCSGSESGQVLCENKDGITKINGSVTESIDGDWTVQGPEADDLMKMNGSATLSKNSISTTTDINSTQEQAASNLQQLSGNSTDLNEGGVIDELKLGLSEMEGAASLSSSTTNNTSKTVDTTKQEAADISTLQQVAKKEDVKPKETKPLCDFSNRRSNLCDMYGDVRIHGKASSVLFVDTSSQRNETWKIKPYARKTDPLAMARVTEFTVKSSNKYENSPQCSVNYSVPAVILSSAGYTGNYFHDFTDILVPLFLTSNQFHGEVQFLVANYQWWWIHKYSLIFENLSKYPVIDIDHDDRIHCFQHTIVGLNSHDDLRIDPWRSPNGISMVDFTRFLRTAYSLPRESPLVIKNGVAKKPRLLIVARSRTRRFTNTNEIVRMAKKLGFEVVVGEAGQNIAQFSQIVNSCDVMMGVHGAGLTNLVFLPTNAIFIQIEPWGNLRWICSTYFGIPAEGMKLRYLEYKISLNESTLTELYPRDHPVLKDPMSLHKLGWDSMGSVYLFKQNVKLDVRRFKPVLQKALRLLHKQ